MDNNYLFRKGKIGNKTVKNRIVYSPTGDNLAAAGGMVTREMIAYYEEKARGGAGIIYIGAVPVDYERGRSHTCAARMDHVKYTIGMEKLTERIHSYEALLIVQLQHAGARTNPDTNDGNRPVCISRQEPETPSIRESMQICDQYEMTADDLKALIPLYVNSAENCMKAGCDGVEIHMSHSFLMNQLLSRDTNHRNDEYGGSLENRMRLPLEVVRAVKKQMGNRGILSARIPGAEYVENGLTPEEIREIAIKLEEAGCDMLNISVGNTADSSKIREPQGSPDGARTSKLANIKQAVTIPVLSAGTFRDPDHAESALERGLTDYIMMARQLICDPMWPEKVRTGRIEEIRPCLTCNAACFKAIPEHKAIGCVINPRAGREAEDLEGKKTDAPKDVAVIGGGPAGMQAAITAAKRGHNVTVYEAGEKTGGQMNLASVPPDKQAIGKACEWFEGEMIRMGVKTITGKKVTAREIIEKNPDHVIYAAGALPWSPDFPGKEKGVWSWDILSGKDDMPEGKTASIIGGGLVGCETGLLMQNYGNKINIIEMMSDVAMGLESANRDHLLKEMKENGAEFYVDTAVREITDDGLVCERNGEELRIDSEVVVLAVGQRPRDPDMAEEIRSAGIDTIMIGDAQRPATFKEATLSGYLAAGRI